MGELVGHGCCESAIAADALYLHGEPQVEVPPSCDGDIAGSSTNVSPREDWSLKYSIVHRQANHIISVFSYPKNKHVLKRPISIHENWGT